MPGVTGVVGVSGPGAPQTLAVTTRRPLRARHPLDGIALSRAGAVAVVMAQRSRGPALRFATRASLLVVGSTVIAAGVAGLLWTGLGPGPLDLVTTAVSARWSVPLTFAVWGLAACMILAATALGRRPGIGTLVLPFLSGALLPVFIRTFGRVTPPAGVSVVGLTAHTAAIAAIGLGAGAVIVAGLGAGMGELLAAAASDRAGRPEPVVRTTIELSWLAIGVALGGAAGVGTILVTLLIGPAVRLGHAVVHRTVRWLPAPAIRSTTSEAVVLAATRTPATTNAR